MAKSCITVCFTYSLRMPIFLNTDISQGSAATRLGCGGAFVHDFVTNFLESNSERILKNGQHLVKLWARVMCLVLLTHSVVFSNNISQCTLDHQKAQMD